MGPISSLPIADYYYSLETRREEQSVAWRFIRHRLAIREYYQQRLSHGIRTHTNGSSAMSRFRLVAFLSLSLSRVDQTSGYLTVGLPWPMTETCDPR